MTLKHAVTHLNNVLKYAYDANGNMTTRDGDTLAYDVENRLTQVVKGATTTNFAYNGDGTRVKREVVGTGTTYYIGNYFEVWVPNSGTTTFYKFYYFGTQRVAAKIAGTLFYFQGDHLGSSSVVMTQLGTSFYSRQTYFPYGAQRTTEGSALPTDYTFTGQKSDDSTGLMFYGARYYDVTLGRFTQPDTIVPSPLNPQSLNRFSYTLNNPVRYIDPNGHMEVDPGAGGGSTGGSGTSGGNATGNGDPATIPQEVVVPDGNGGVTIIDCDQKPHAIGCGNNKTAQAKPAPTPKMPVANGKSQAPNQSSKPTASSTPSPCWNGTISTNCPSPDGARIFDPSCRCAMPASEYVDPLSPTVSYSLEVDWQTILLDGPDVVKANALPLFLAGFTFLTVDVVTGVCAGSAGLACPIAVVAGAPVVAASTTATVLSVRAAVEIDRAFIDKAFDLKKNITWTKQAKDDWVTGSAPTDLQLY